MALLSHLVWHLRLHLHRDSESVALAENISSCLIYIPYESETTLLKNRISRSRRLPSSIEVGYTSPLPHEQVIWKLLDNVLI